jgi:hypothetical protein
MCEISYIGLKPVYRFLALACMLVPLQANAEQIILICDVQMNIRSADAQGNVIQDDWRPLTMEIELKNDEYFMTTVNHGHSFDSRGALIYSSQKYFLKIYNQVKSKLMTEIFSQSYIDRITGEYYSNDQFFNNETGGISSFVIRGPCVLQDAPITKF